MESMMLRTQKEALLIFTGKSADEMMRVGGTQSWVLDPARARQCDYAILCRNAHNPASWADGRGPHGSAFMVGHISEVVPSTEVEKRWLVKFDSFALIDIPNVWAGWRNPVQYRDLPPVDLETMNFEPMPQTEADIAHVPRLFDGAMKPLTIEEAKRGLAATFGVKPEAVEITIRG